MIITCENCQTKFKVDPAKLGPTGKKVRCVSCKHLWHVNAEGKADEMPAAPAPKEEKKVAAEDKPKPQVKAEARPAKKPVADERESEAKISTQMLKVAACVLFLLNIFGFVFFNKEIIGQTAFYDMVGNYDTRAVEIISHDITSKPVEKGTDLQIAWVVKNTSGKTMRMPIVRFKLFDESLELIGQKRNEREDVRLKAGEELKFKDTLIHNAKAARYFTVEIGNNTELATR